LKEWKGRFWAQRGRRCCHLSQAPGGLELLPTADYNDGKPWLFVRDSKETI
jgi:hypothetical protein